MGSRPHADASPPPTPAAPASASAPALSFGVERILSGAFPRHRPQSPPPLLPPPHCPTVVAPTPGFGVPCAECVSSLLRCCRLSDAAHHHQHHQHHQPQHRLHQHHQQQQQQPAYTVHSPRPIRPYTNMLQLSESHAPSPTLPGGLHAGAAAGGGSGGGAGAAAGGGGGGGKRKRSWSRAVFSNLQRKGLEKRFQLQKYITKPDRRQLAATLGLTDAQVKVWFQNRRMKWRHSREAKAAAPAAAPAAAATGDAAVDSTQRDPPEGDAEAELVDVQAIDSG